MTCERWRDAISCITDGEPSDIDPELVAAHVAKCPACQTFEADAERTRRILRVQPAPTMPDLAPRIVKLHRMSERIGRWSFARTVLAVVAVEIVVLSVPDLVLGDQDDVTAHAARHLGAFSVAYAVALLVVVVRPARARTVLPVALVLAGMLSITAIVDVIGGHVPLVREAQHLPEVLSVILVWLLASPAPRRAVGGRAAPPRPRSLRVVDDERQTG